MLTRNWKVLISNLLWWQVSANIYTIDASAKQGKLRTVVVNDDTPVLKSIQKDTSYNSYIYNNILPYLPCGSYCVLDYNAAGANYNNSHTSLSSLNNSEDSQTYGGYAYLWWGTGTTPPTEADYRLETPITKASNLTLVETENRLCPVYSEVTGSRQNGTMTFTQHVYCCSPTVTINEYGLFKYIGTSTSGTVAPAPTSSNNSLVMYAREVLEEPITLLQGQTLKFSYTISTFDMGTESTWTTVL